MPEQNAKPVESEFNEANFIVDDLVQQIAGLTKLVAVLRAGIAQRDAYIQNHTQSGGSPCTE